MSLGGDDVRPFTPVAAVASQFVLSAKRGDDPGDAARAVSYTHLTLPTICSV